MYATNNECAEALTRRAEELRIDIAPLYEEWIQLGFALADGLGPMGRSYYHRLCALYARYSYEECERQYTNCLATHKGKITFKTLFHLAKIHGVEIAPQRADTEAKTNEHSQCGQMAKWPSGQMAKWANGQTDGSGADTTEPDDLESVMAPVEELPVFPPEVYTDLPPLFKSIVSKATSPKEADMLLLTALTVVSVALPKVAGVYDQRKVHPNLYFFLTAMASAGKGIMAQCLKLVEPIHYKLKNASDCEREEYRKLNIAYQNAKNKEHLEKPVEPPLRLLIVPADVGTTSIIEMANNNGGQMLMFETESETVNNAFKQEHGNYAHLLLKAFHHERISFLRRRDNEHADIADPRFSLVLSGTPGQVAKLMPDVENGLLSRFMFYYLNMAVEWRDVFVGFDKETIDDFYAELGQQFYTIYTALDCSDVDPFVLQPAQQQRFNNFFEEIQRDYAYLFGLEIVASIRRLGLIAFRIAMIFTALRIDPTVGGHKTMVCSDADFDRTIAMMRVLLQHTAFVFDTLIPKVPVDLKQKDAQNPRAKTSDLYQALPLAFNYQQAAAVGASLNMSQRSLRRYIAALIAAGKLERGRHGEYKKIAPAEK